MVKNYKLDLLPIKKFTICNIENIFNNIIIINVILQIDSKISI